MSKAEFNISQRLQFWFDKTGKTIPQLCRYYNGINKSVIMRWLGGGLIRIETLYKLSEFFGVTPARFYGKTVRRSEDRPCGIKKVLEILNEEGDYFGEDSKLALSLHDNELVKPVRRMHRTRDE